MSPPGRRDSAGNFAQSVRGPAFARVAALVACVVLAACSDEDECPKLTRNCDISRVTCQREVFAATACTRGQEGARMPPIRAITRDEFAAELQEEAGDEDDFGERAWSGGLALFGLIPSQTDADEASAGQRGSDVLAFYRSDEKDVTIIVDGAIAASEGTFVLAHEFVHALQDQREDLNAFAEQFAETSDDSLSLRCLTEGEAVMVSNLAMPSKGDLAALDWDRYFAQMLGGSLEAIESADAPLYAARTLVYPVGGRGVVAERRKAGARGVTSLYGAPPPTFRGWAASRPSLLEPEPMDCLPPDPPEGYEPRFLDRQGMAGLISLYAALDRGARYDDAHAWVSDWYALYSAEDESSEDVAVAWRIRFGSRTAASLFVDEIDFSRLGIDAERFGQEVLLSAASSEELLTGWDRSGGCDSDKARGRSAAALSYRIPRSLRRSLSGGPHSLHALARSER